jgi:protein tyrosine phosphatase (PTP) superfamily phosphohydrolase (DUF442 family)
MIGLTGGRATGLRYSILCLGIVVCSAMAQQESTESLRKQESKYLPNAIWVHPTVVSGGLPVGKAAFEELARFGIKTIISVDGIKPDVQGAEAAGLRYVHLPHGYDGISEERLLQIAKAIRDLPGPVYIHCHHGKHRSPAAAAAACIMLGKIPASRGLEVLKMAGTNMGFRGLVRAVDGTVVLAPDRLDNVTCEFDSVAEVPPMVDAMVAMDAIMDRLKEHQHRGWDASGLEAASDALLLKEHYMELHRSESEKKQEAEFLELLDQGRTLVERLEDRLQVDRARSSLQDLADANSLMKQLTVNCARCHSQYRDNR